MKRVGLIGLALIAIMGVVAPFVWGAQAEEMTGVVRAGITAEHWLGTDPLGRDVLARTLTATRLTLLMTLAATALAGLSGILAGAAIWVAGPRVRAVGLRLIDLAVSYPSLILAMVIATVIGAGPLASVVAIGLGGAPVFARLTANLAASVAGRDFVATARLLGVPPSRVLSRHLLPNIAGPLLVLLSVAFASILTALSGLSFLGLSVQPPDYDWGSLLSSGLADLYTNPAEALGPALAITMTGVLAGLVGDGLAADTEVHPPKVRRRPITTTPPTASGKGLLRVKDLHVRLADGTALVDGISFTVHEGEVVGLVGESGSGKSLTAMAAAHLLPDNLVLEASELALGDLDLRTTRDKGRLAAEIGVVFQDPSSSFNPALRLGGQLTETIRLHQGAGRAEARRRALEALERVRIREPERVLRQYPHELSGGMRQRAMIAAALLPGPRLLIADEPTTALDVTVQAEVLDLLRELNPAMLFISHDIGVVRNLCDRVLVMYGGRIVEELAAGSAARHPYTQALLAAAPHLEDQLAGRLATIPGRPPAPAERGQGCAFAARCALVSDRCRAERPELLEGVACFEVIA